MRIASILGAVISAGAIVSPAAAQEEAAPPPIFQVTTAEVSPATLFQYAAALQKQAETAQAVGVSAAEMGWWTWQTGNRFLTVRPRSRDAMFSGPGPRAAIREAMPAADSAIMTAFRGVEMTASSNEIVQLNPNRSYAPEGAMMEPGGMQLMEMRIASGQGAAFNAAVQEMLGILRELKYPYAMNMYTVRYGEGRTQWVTFYDTRERFHGVNSFDRLFEANPEVAARAMPIYESFLKTISSMNVTEYRYAKELSFPPPTN